MIIAQALLFKDGLIIVEVADEQVEFDKFSFHKTILSTHCSSAFLLLIRLVSFGESPLLLPFEQPAEEFVGALEDGAALPLLVGDGARLSAVAGEVFADALGERFVEGGEVHFVV